MRYAIIEAGKVTNVIEADETFAASIGAVLANEDTSIGDTYDGTSFIKPTPPIPVVTAPTRRLSKLGFVGRLGNDFATILTAAKTSVEIEMFVRMLDWATPDADGTSVDLDDQRVVYALNSLETAGILAAGRAQEILA